LSFSIAQASEIIKSHAISMDDTPKYSENFTHFDYVNPNAKKGGFVKLSSIGTYDSFNPFVIKGVSADGLNLIYDTLMVQSDDEPFTEYGLVAKYIEYPKDRSWVIFHINKKARFHDNTPITAEDVKFSFEILIKKGSPIYRRYYSDVSKVEVLDKYRVKFTFKEGSSKEAPLILGQLNIFPKKYWEKHDFSKANLEIPLASGPYKIKSFKAGKSITYERVKNYWAKDLPVMKGRYNFDKIRYDYYRDQTVSLEAFKSGEYDFIQENRSKQWATMYKGPMFNSGKIIKEVIRHYIPLGMQGFAMNTRREIFKDKRVRHAIILAFDFEWTNKNLFYSQYKRTESYYSNSELASRGLPSKEELEILEPLRDLIPEEVFTKEYKAPKTDGTGNNRLNLRKAMKLLKQAGYKIENKKLVDKNGKPFVFEVLIRAKAFERVMLPYQKNLAKLGIKMRIRLVDSSQYINRIRNFDYDMTVVVIGQSNSPGNEQYYYWDSKMADVKGSMNYMGIKNPAVDTLTTLVVSAQTRKDLIYRTRALDRVLLWNHYIVPNWNYPYFRVAYKRKFAKPKIQPKYSLGFFNWWIK
jgi:microcin C transport system substrate-binding protein